MAIIMWETLERQTPYAKPGEIALVESGHRPPFSAATPAIWRPLISQVEKFTLSLTFVVLGSEPR